MHAETGCVNSALAMIFISIVWHFCFKNIHENQNIYEQSFKVSLLELNFFLSVSIKVPLFFTLVLLKLLQKS